MKWFALALTTISSCTQQNHTAVSANYGHFVASPPFVGTDYVLDVIASGQRPAVLFTILPGGSSSEPSIIRRYVTSALATDLLKDMTTLATAKPENNECTDSIAYLVVVQAGNDVNSKVANSCDPATERAASRLHAQARSIFGEAVPGSSGWIPDPPTRQGIS
ncbi:MAG: hypothetical protein HOP91_08465 [Sphingomonas sp.]|nr:hypothetical protein [Sphingomonas sp.]